VCVAKAAGKSDAGAELDYVTAASFAYPALHKGEELGEYESTYVPMHHIHPSALFESHSASSSAAVQLADERNWFGPKCSHDQQMAKEEEAGLVEERKLAQATRINRTRGRRCRSGFRRSQPR
jgi:hypothetical protein